MVGKRFARGKRRVFETDKAVREIRGVKLFRRVKGRQGKGELDQGFLLDGTA